MCMAGADVNAVDDRGDSILVAVLSRLSDHDDLGFRSKIYNTTRCLLDAGATPEVEEWSLNDSLLHLTCFETPEYSHIRIIGALLQGGLDRHPEADSFPFEDSENCCDVTFLECRSCYYPFLCCVNMPWCCDCYTKKCSPSCYPLCCDFGGKVCYKALCCPHTACMCCIFSHDCCECCLGDD